MANPIVTFTMENGDVMKAELYPEIAPTSVNNFVNLVQKGFYDGLIFHRVIAGFMIQGGDPEGTGMGGPGYSIKGEFASNGFKNDLKHTRGVLSMARSMRPDSAGSQFFIMHQNAPHLDGDYAAFGKLIEGEDILDKIAGVDTDYSDRPRKPQVMKTVTVETFGEEYPEPEKLSFTLKRRIQLIAVPAIIIIWLLSRNVRRSHCFHRLRRCFRCYCCAQYVL